MTVRFADRPLDSVAAELGATLAQVQSALERYCEAPQASAAALADVVDGLQHLSAVCSALELSALATQIGALHDLGLRLQVDAGSEAEELREHLLEQVLGLGRQLAWLRYGADLPGAASAPPHADDTRLREVADELRPVLQRTLLGMLRGVGLAHHLEQLVEVLARIKDACGGGPDYELWWRAQGFGEVLRDAGVPPLRAQHLLLRELDQRLRLLAQYGEDGASTAAIEELSTRLDTVLGETAVGRAWLNNRIDYQPGGSGVTEGALIGSVLTDPDTLRTIGALLGDMLGLAKGAIETRTRTGMADAAGLRDELAELRDAANVLTLIGMEAPAALLQQWLSRLDQMIESAQPLVEDTLLALARDLVLVENSVEGIVDLAYAPPLAPGQDPFEAIHSLDAQHARASVARAASELMQQAREQVDLQLRGDASTAVWHEVGAVLGRVAGVVTMLEVPAAARLLHQLQYAIHCAEHESGRLDQAIFPSTVAEAMVVGEYFFDRLAQGQHTAPDTLDNACEALVEVCGVAPDWPAAGVQVTSIEPATVVAPQTLAEPVAEQALPAEEEMPSAVVDEGSLPEVIELAPFAPSLSPSAPSVEAPHGDLPATVEPATEPDWGSGAPVEVSELDELPEEFRHVLAERQSASIEPAAEPVEPTAPDLPEVAEVAEEPATVVVPDGIDPELHDIFLEEAGGEFESVREMLAALALKADDLENLRTLRRAFHTLKGGARMVGETVAGEFAWSVEHLLNRVLDSRSPPTPLVLELTAEAAAALSSWLLKGKRTPGARALLETLGGRIDELAERIRSGEAEAAPQPPVAPEMVEPAVVVAAEEPAVVEPMAEPVTEPAPVLVEPIAMVEPGAAVAAPPAPASTEPPAETPAWLEALLLVLDDCREGSTSSRDAMVLALEDALRNAPPLVERLAQMLKGYLTQLQALGRGLDANDILLCEDCVGAFEVMLRNRTPDMGDFESLLQAIAKRAAALSAAPALVSPSTVIDRELAAVFLAEAADILDAADVTLARWRQDRSSSALLNDLRREMHTLKGSSRMAGFTQIGDLAHATEFLLDACASGRAEPTDIFADGLQHALDRFSEMVARIEAGGIPQPAEGLIRDLQEILEQGSVSSHPSTEAAHAEPVEMPMQTGAAHAGSESVRVSSTLLDNLVNQMGESSIFRARIEQGVSAFRFNLGELEQIASRLRAQMRRLEIETEAQILFRFDRGGVDPNADFDPLELDRFSELQQLSRQLLEAVEDLTNIQSVLVEQSTDIGTLLEQQGKVDRELQQGLMQTRVVRFETIVPRLRRVVRQAAEETGKQVDLQLRGAEAELERNLLEALVAPLEHMLRNAVSHGIELPEERQAAGKEEGGTITITLRREGAEILLTVADDGRGLDYQAIRAAAERRGLLEPGAPASDVELANLLLLPGFSTAKSITQLSGRGVGLDVLASAISAVRGALSIQSQTGLGATFQLRLPFSLSVTQALLVRAGDEVYAVPLLSVEAISRLGAREFREYLAGSPVEHEYTGDGFAVHSLAAVFGGTPPSATTAESRPPVLLFRSADTRAAMQVDTVIGRQEIIVKPVGPQLAKVPGISGATVLSDGRVVVILDMPVLVRSLVSATRRAQEAATLRAARLGDEGQPASVLVVDDSITMRKVAARILERQGITVQLAKDGVDAIEQLDTFMPDLIMLDIEMPRMDGFELLAHIRNQSRLRHLPVVMITSRTGDKHRERANRLGVSAYLGKPYQEEQLLDVLRQVLGARALRDGGGEPA